MKDLSCVSTFINNCLSCPVDFNQLITSVCTIIATIIAILSFKEAKKTVFQSEFISRRTDLLVNVINFLNQGPFSLFLAPDYEKIINFNWTILLEQCGYISLSSEQKNYIYNMTPMRVLNPSLKVDKKTGIVLLKNRSAEEYREFVKSDDFVIEQLYLTTTHYTTQNTLRGFVSNIFMPKNIAFEIDSLIKDINSNTELIWNTILVNAIKEVCKKNDPTLYNSTYLNNEIFNKSCKTHASKIEKINVMIKSVLRIKELDNM